MSETHYNAAGATSLAYLRGTREVKLPEDEE
jgi:hypothetical protein